MLFQGVCPFLRYMISVSFVQCLSIPASPAVAVYPSLFSLSALYITQLCSTLPSTFFPVHCSVQHIRVYIYSIHRPRGISEGKEKQVLHQVYIYIYCLFIFHLLNVEESVSTVNQQCINYKISWIFKKRLSHVLYCLLCNVHKQSRTI